MEVALHPIGGRVYRLTEGDRQLLQGSGAIRPAGGGGPPSAPAPRHLEEDDDMDAPDTSFVKQRASGQFFVKLSADPQLYAFVIGKQGATKSRIEHSSGATIRVPRKGQAGQEIEITGSTAADVARAFRQVEAVIHSAISSPRLPYTHFVSIPLTSVKMQENLGGFRDRLVADARAQSEWKISAETFQTPLKFHQTIAVLKLYTSGMRNAAQQVLKSFEGSHSGTPLQIAVRGLDIMNDDPSQCHVLYAKVSDAEGGGTELQGFCDEVVKALSSAGLVLDKDSGSVKLHATVINSKFAAAEADAEASGRLRRQPFDARAILAEEGGAEFGQHSLEWIHLSTMGATGPDGFYTPLLKVALSNG